MESCKQRILSKTSIKIAFFYRHTPWNIKLFLFIKLRLVMRDFNLMK